MAVVMIVRTAPDAARTQGEEAEHPHEHLRSTRAGQDGVVLLIVVNDEESEEQQTAQHAAKRLSREVEVPVGAGQRRQQKGGG